MSKMVYSAKRYIVTNPDRPNRAARRRRVRMAGRMNSRGTWWGNPGLSDLGGAVGQRLMDRLMFEKNLSRWPDWQPRLQQRRAFHRQMRHQTMLDDYAERKAQRDNKVGG